MGDSVKRNNNKHYSISVVEYFLTRIVCVCVLVCVIVAKLHFNRYKMDVVIHPIGQSIN